MKTVYIVRHAKSSWKETDLMDEQRPLLEKGKKRTKKIIDFLHEKKVKVDYIISSHAVRALDTAKILAHALGYPTDQIKIDPHIYISDGERIFNQFFDLSEKYKSVMIVGHNPALTDFVNHFLDPRIDNLPTSGVVSVSFLTDRWDEIPTAKFKVNFMAFPKIFGKKD
jgi:phosphohistidine phosphatase